MQGDNTDVQETRDSGKVRKVLCLSSSLLSKVLSCMHRHIVMIDISPPRPFLLLSSYWPPAPICSCFRSLHMYINVLNLNLNELPPIIFLHLQQ